jgi:hypothetical protein
MHDAGGAGSIKVVLDRKRPSATSMAAEAARFGKTESGGRIYHGTTRAPARTIAWAGDLVIPLKQFLLEVGCEVLALKQKQPTLELAAAIPACKNARRTAPANGDTKKKRQVCFAETSGRRGRRGGRGVGALVCPPWFQEPQATALHFRTKAVFIFISISISISVSIRIMPPIIYLYL